MNMVYCYTTYFQVSLAGVLAIMNRLQSGPKVAFKSIFHLLCPGMDKFEHVKAISRVDLFSTFFPLLALS